MPELMTPHVEDLYLSIHSDGNHYSRWVDAERPRDLGFWVKDGYTEAEAVFRVSIARDIRRMSGSWSPEEIAIAIDNVITDWET